MMDKSNKLALLKELAGGMGGAEAAPDGEVVACPTCGHVAAIEEAAEEEGQLPPLAL
jgi:hypothetical protein